MDMIKATERLADFLTTNQLNIMHKNAVEYPEILPTLGFEIILPHIGK